MMPMTDAELAAFLGIAGKHGCARILASITPKKRALFERMAKLESDVKLWQDGGPKPRGVIICGCGNHRGKLSCR